MSAAAPFGVWARSSTHDCELTIAVDVSFLAIYSDQVFATSMGPLLEAPAPVIPMDVALKFKGRFIWTAVKPLTR